MKQYKDHAIILSRIDYGERDRILTLLCEKQGKISVLAKGVRAEKSRLAGGIELLSESEVSFIDGKSSLKTLTGARLSVHFGKLVGDMRRMNIAFDHIKAINDITEDSTGQEYYHALLTSFLTLNNKSFDSRITDIWFNLLVLRLSGSAPNLSLVDNKDEAFGFDYDNQQFTPSPAGAYSQNDLKLLRVCMIQVKPPKFQKELGSEDRLQSLVRTLLKTNVTEV